MRTPAAVSWNALIESGANPRDRAILGLMLYAGLREGEITRLSVADLDPADGWVWSAGGWVELHPRACDLVAEWLAHHPEADRADAPAFRSLRGGPLHRSQVWRIVSTAIQDAGGEGTPDTLRYSCAERMLSRGATGAEVRDHLRLSGPIMAALLRDKRPSPHRTVGCNSCACAPC